MRRTHHYRAERMVVTVGRELASISILAQEDHDCSIILSHELLSQLRAQIDDALPARSEPRTIVAANDDGRRSERA